MKAKISGKKAGFYHVEHEAHEGRETTEQCGNQSTENTEG
jgi:hypothetical protein